MDTVVSPDVTKRRIVEMLETLTPDDLKVVERLAACLRGQESRVPGLAYPTIFVPGEGLASWSEPTSRGGQGHALADTEALYDEADCP